MSELSAIKGLIIEFQKKIVELKSDLRQIQDSTDKESRRGLLEQLEWFDLLSMTLDDLRLHQQSHSQAAQAPIIFKSLERLKNKMQRYFEMQLITLVEVKNSFEGTEAIKVLDTQKDPSLSNGTVIEVIRPGYRWKGQVLRKAELITIRNDPPSPPA